jgi:POT family proton-dependent oligopeptide transporter
LFHTLGELCISPVGLSYVSKLVPGRMIAVTYGIWYLAIAVGNKVAGTMGSNIDSISESHGLSFFFLIFTFVPIGAALMVLILGPYLRKLMHGIR